MDDPEAEGGSDVGDDALGGGGGEAPEEEPSCVPDFDAPDDDFTDTNCDGIDGDISHAVFVSPLGTVGAKGSMDDPVATIGEGIQLAQEKSRDVYVCRGTYPEELTMSGSGVNIYGGYDCGKGWERGEHEAVVAPFAGIPLSVRDVSGARIERLRFEAPDATTPGGSSRGALIVDSVEIELHRIALAAGVGFAGIDGTAGAKYSLSARAGASATGNCTSVYCGTGGIGGYTGPASTCPNGVSVSPGGRGGNGASVSPHSPATNGSGPLYTYNLGGLVSAVPSQRNGRPGIDLSPATNGKASALLLGSFVGHEYQPTNSGAAGMAGGHGSGGGGGAGASMIDNGGSTSFRAGDGGGQGGFGGCGGRAGTGGTGGGGSFALVIAGSEVAVTMSEFSSAQGGSGGAGGAGAAGQLGGAGALALGKLSPGGAGGRGANGGAGGDGAPGGGGPSIVIALLSGESPSISESTLSPAVGGNGGIVPAGGYGKAGLSAEGYSFGSGMELKF